MANGFAARAHLMLHTPHNPSTEARPAGLAGTGRHAPGPVRPRRPDTSSRHSCPGQQIEATPAAHTAVVIDVEGLELGQAAVDRAQMPPTRWTATRVASGSKLWGLARPVLRGSCALSGPQELLWAIRAAMVRPAGGDPGNAGGHLLSERIWGGSLTLMSFDARDIPPEFFERRKPRRWAVGFRPRELFWPIRPMEPSTPSIPPMRVPELESAINPFSRPRRGSRLNVQPDDPDPEPRSSGPSSAPDRLCRLGSPTPMPDPVVRLGRGFPQSSLKGGKPRPSGAQSQLPD